MAVGKRAGNSGNYPTWPGFWSGTQAKKRCRGSRVTRRESRRRGREKKGEKDEEEKIKKKEEEEEEEEGIDEDDEEEEARGGLRYISPI
jgi:hypothetical protein